MGKLDQKATYIELLVNIFRCFDVTGSYLDLNTNISSYLAYLYSTCFGIYNIMDLVSRICFSHKMQDESIFSKMSMLRIGKIYLSGLNRWLIAC